MQGLKLACLYSYGCTRAIALNMNRKLAVFLKNKKPSQSEINLIITEIMRLNSFKGYQAIAKTLNKEPFEKEIVIGYWLGSDNHNLERLNHNFITVTKLKTILKSNCLVDEVINTMLGCAISFGRIIELGLKRARICGSGFLYKDASIVFEEKQNKSIAIDFLPKAKNGDLVSIHFGKAREKISQKQTEILKQNSLRTLKILNNQALVC